MPPGTGAQGFLGIASETVPGTYVAPTLFVPIESESLQFQQETIWRRPIRQSADIVGAVDGNAHVEGDVGMEAFEDVVATILAAGRTNVVQTGADPNYTYEITGSAAAVPNSTLSITVVRNEVVFGYVGMVMNQFAFTVEDGQLKFNPSFIGQDEAAETAPVPTWATDIQQQPYGAGKYHLEIPTATQIFDADGFEFTVDDSGEPQYRLKDTGRGAQFVSFGERSVSLSLDRDFESRADYDAFKALTAQGVTLSMVKGANNSIKLEIPAAIKDTYEVGLSGQGDLTRASIAYNGVLDSLGNAYKITIKCQTDLGLA